MSPLDEVGLDHDTHDQLCGIGALELGSDILRDVDLLLVLLAAVSVRAINHDPSWHIGLGKLLSARAHVLSCVVGALGSTAQDDVRIGVALRLDDTAEAFLAHTEEAVAALGRSASIYGDTNTAVGRV